jgi:hypothetical protein
MTAVGIIPKQTLPLEDAWYVEYRYDDTDGSSHMSLSFNK